jgi:hypothetical protein
MVIMFYNPLHYLTMQCNTPFGLMWKVTYSGILLPCGSVVFLCPVSTYLGLFTIPMFDFSPTCVHAGHLAPYTFSIATA